MNGQRAPAYAAGVVGAFVIVGLGVGLVQNFSLGFLIENLVDPGTNPTDNTLVGIVLIMDIFLPFAYGMVLAGAFGFVVGRAMAARRGVATLTAGVGSGVGFVLFDFLALFLTFSVLSQYGGGGGGGGPFGPSDLLPVIFQAAIPAAVVGGSVAYLAARVTATGSETRSEAGAATDAESA